jgi:hypothetical protein
VDRKYVKTEKQRGRAWAGFVWLWIAATGVLVRTWKKHPGDFLSSRETISFAKEATPYGVCQIVNSGTLLGSEGAKIVYPQQHLAMSAFRATC